MALTKEQKKIYKEYKVFLNAELRVDSEMIKESIRNYIIEDVDYTNKVCLDLGSNLGAFSKIAIDNGAARVFAVECDSRNFAKVNENFENTPNVEVIHAAVSGSSEDTIKIYKSNAKSNHSSTSIVKKTNRFREYDEVRNVNFTELVSKHKPDILKIDIEGAEYEIIDSVLEYNADVLFIELHGNHQLSQQSLQRLIDSYPNNKIEEIIAFNSIIGYDCLFYK